MKKKHFEWMTSFVVVLLSAAMISCSSETDGLEEVESSTSSQFNVLLYIVKKNAKLRTTCFVSHHRV